MKLRIKVLLTLMPAGMLMVPFQIPASASDGTITAAVGSGVSSAPHVAGQGDWTFDLIGMSGQIRRVTVAVRLESCSGPVHGYVEASRPSAGTQFTIPSVPAGRHCARASAEGTNGSTVEYTVKHPVPAAPGTVTILRPTWEEPFTLGTPRWPLWVSAVVVGTGEDWDSSTNDLDWYDCMAGSCTLAATNMSEGYLTLATGAHTLVATLSSPGEGAQDAYNVIVREEVTVTLGRTSFSGSTVYVPFSVTDQSTGVAGHAEGRVFNQAGQVVAYPSADMDAVGNGTFAFRITKSGTYRIEVHAYGSQSQYGYALGTFAR